MRGTSNWPEKILSVNSEPERGTGGTCKVIVQPGSVKSHGTLAMSVYGWTLKSSLLNKIGALDLERGLLCTVQVKACGYRQDSR